MKIVLCTKQVPSVEDVRFDRDKGTIIREGVPNEINPFDRRGLGQAIELRRQHGGEVIAVTMGPPQAKEVLWECLAVGADRAVHINDPALAGSDTLATARVLAAFLRREQPDVILCGKYSVDADTGQVGPEVAAMLGIPQITGATSLQIEGNRAMVGRETDAGIDMLEVELPALLTAGERLIRPPRYEAADLEKAKTAAIETLTAAQLGLRADEVGFSGSPTWVTGIEELKPQRSPIVIQNGDAAQTADQVAKLLEQRGVFQQLSEGEKLQPLPPPLANPRSDRSIMVVTELNDGEISPVTHELLGGAAELAQSAGAEVCALVIGHNTGRLAQELARRGAAIVYVADDPRLQSYDAETYSWVLASAVRAHQPWAVLVPATSQGRDYAPRVAGELGLGLTGDAIGLEIDGEGRLCQLKPAFGGTIVATILTKTVPQMVTVRAGMLNAHQERPVEAQIVALPLAGLPEPRARLVSSEAQTSEDGRLDEAKIVVCAGAGLGGPENLAYVDNLAGALGGLVGGTRKVVDAGWLPRQKQIGLTGVIFNPQLYIGVGVRGAFNHVIGIQRAGTIVSINSDPDALMTQHSDIAIIGDYQEIVPALTARLQRATPAARH